MDIKNAVYIALFAAITAALGIFPPITVPAVGAPITAQSMAVMLAGGILGAKRGALSIMLFLILAAVGLPLLAGGRGGIGIFATPSGGFLLGWIFGAFVTGYIVEKTWANLNVIHAFMASVGGGIVMVYAFGIPWVAISAKINLDVAALGAVAYVPGDLIKTVLAAAIIMIVKKSYPIITTNQ